MTNDNARLCDLCGEHSGKGRIYFSHPMPANELEKYDVHSAALDMRLCQLCGERTFKHLKRMFTLQHFGLKRKDVAQGKRFHPRSGKD